MADKTKLELNPYHRFTKAEWAQYRDGEPMTLDRRRHRAAARPDRSDLARRGRGDLPAAQPPDLVLCRGGAGGAPRLDPLPRHRGPQDPFIIGVAGSVASASRPPRASCARCCSAGAPRPRSTSSPPTASFSERRARRARPHRAQGLSRKLRPRRAARLPLRHQVGQARRQGAGLFAPRLRHRARRVRHHRPARHPDRRGAQHPPAGRAAEDPASRSSSPRTSSISRSIIDADEADLRDWFMERFRALRETAFTDPKSFFHRFAEMPERGGRRLRAAGLGQHQPASICATTSCRPAAAPT